MIYGCFIKSAEHFLRVYIANMGVFIVSALFAMFDFSTNRKKSH